MTLERKIERASRDQVQVQSQLQQLSVTINNQITNNAADPEAVESQRELLKEIQEQLQSKEAMKKVFEEAMADMKGERTGMKIRDVKGTQKGQALAGIIGGPADSYHGTMDISGVSAADESIAAAGVIQNYEFKHY